MATKLKLVGLLEGTVLQGNVIIAENHFEKLYPDSGGSRFFLVACSPAGAATVRTVLTTQLTSRGLFLSSAPERLAQFQAVQNTYLTIFSTLGGLALVLATVGLGILVARHVTERRSEFAVLAAGGFRLRDLRRMILAEHWFLFVFAILLGALTALIAVAPSLHLAGSGGLPVGLLAVLLISILLGGFLFCSLAARFTLRGTLAASLRSE